jgi:hypothetical protein
LVLCVEFFAKRLGRAHDGVELGISEGDWGHWRRNIGLSLGGGLR